MRMHKRGVRSLYAMDLATLQEMPATRGRASIVLTERALRACYRARHTPAGLQCRLAGLSGVRLACANACG